MNGKCLDALGLQESDAKRGVLSRSGVIGTQLEIGKQQ